MEVLIVGRGFSGSLASLLLADRGYSVTSADPNPVIPHCTGIVSKRFVDLMGIDDLVLSEPERLILRLGKFFIEINVPGKSAVIDREALDRELRDASEAAGARILKKRIHSLSPDGTADGRKYDRIVDAEGAKRKLVKQRFGSLETLPGLQYDVEADWGNDVLIDLNVDGLFGRIVPLDDGKARVGLATREGHMEKIRPLLKLARTRKIISRRGGLVVVSGPRGGMVKDNILLIGDAAGVPKPLTGGGLMFGLFNVISAVRNIEEPKKYEREFMREFSKEYRVQRFLRRIKDLSRLIPWPFYPLLSLAGKLSKNLDMDFWSGTRTPPLSDINRIRSYLSGASRA